MSSAPPLPTTSVPPASMLPPSRKVAVTRVIIGLNLLVFLWQLSLQGPKWFAFEQRYALSLDGVMSGAWWQFLTYQFLHGGWVHLLFNLFFLNSLGPVLEDTLGAGRYLALYLVSGVVGGAIHLAGAWLWPGAFGHPVVGASAGLCGLLAAICTIYAEEPLEVRLFLIIPVIMRAKFLLLAVSLVSMAGILFGWGNVAHLAHFGGLLGGLLVLNVLNVETIPVEPPVQ